MSEYTDIQWCMATWSPWLGCRKVSEGCKNCYITTTTPFRVRGIQHGARRDRLSDAGWKMPLRWNVKYACGVCSVCGRPGTRTGGQCQCGAVGMYERPRVFPSLCDWLDDEVPIKWLSDFLWLIHKTPNLDWLLLTKRPENFESLLWDIHETNGLGPVGSIEKWLRGEPWDNVWLGVSCENQSMADKRIPELIKIPAKVRFVSAEPLLGPIDFDFMEQDASPHPNRRGLEIDWIIFGGESGPNARPCNIDWIRDGIKQCKAAGIPAFVKQLGGNLSDQDLDECAKASGKSMQDKKGGDPSEWPFSLRLVRNFPKLMTIQGED